MQQFKQAPSPTETHEVKARVVFLKPRTLAAVQVHGPYAESAPKAWHAMFEWLEQTKPTPTPIRGFGFFYNDPREVKAEKLRYRAAVEIPENWDECNNGILSPMRFDGGTFLRSKVVGPYTETGKVISNLRDQWVPKNGLVLDQAQPILAIFHSDARHVAPAEQITEMCLPVFADRRKEQRN